MNQIVPMPEHNPVHMNTGLIPASMGEAMKLAEMMAGAKLVPAPLQKSPADCLMVVMQAVRWSMDPFAVAQECSVIQGKLMHSGKLVAAVVNARGNLSERLSFAYDGEGDKRTITVSGRLHGEATARTVTVRLGDARTVNKVWQTQPDQQLMYHGCRVWARRHTPELMLGVYSPEEFDEATNSSGVMRDVTPAANVPASTAALNSPAQTPDDLEALMLRSMAAITDLGKLYAWSDRHKEAFARLPAEAKKRVTAAAKKRAADLERHDPETGELIEANAGQRFADYDRWLADMEDRLKVASDEDQATIWSDEIAPRMEAGEVFPADRDRLRGLLRNTA